MKLRRKLALAPSIEQAYGLIPKCLQSIAPGFWTIPCERAPLLSTVFICGETVRLNERKATDRGEAAHESCLVDQLLEEIKKHKADQGKHPAVADRPTG
jgi:hypothetical protein